MKVGFCKISGKVMFSEAKAQRRVEKYEDITACYFCKFCGAYHLTSVERRTTLKKPNPTKEQIKKRINQIKL